MYRSKIYDIGKDDLQAMLDESSSYAEVLAKLKMSKHGANHRTLKKIINEYELDVTKIDDNRRKQLSSNKSFGIHKSIPIEDILSGVYQGEYHTDRLKKRLFSDGYKEKKCERCGNTKWLENDIPLQLHHKDGDRTNNKLENLEILCPNCHALTDTFAGKNSKKPKENKRADKTKQEDIVKPTREQLKKDIRVLGMVHIRHKYHIGDEKLRKWCDEYGLPRYKDDIYNISDEDWINI